MTRVTAEEAAAQLPELLNAALAGETIELVRNGQPVARLVALPGAEPVPVEPPRERLERHRKELEALCRRHHVQELYIFGSALREDFKPGRSDYDFLVKFLPCTPDEHVDRYFGLWESLEALLNSNVDLIELGALKNPYFISEVEETRVLVYAA